MSKIQLIKNIQKSIIAAFVISFIVALSTFTVSCENISTKIIRLHVLANSDSEYDQELKLKVKDKVNTYVGKLLENIHTKEEAEKIISENLNNISAVAQQEVYDNDYNYSVNAKLLNMDFENREYGRFTLPAGRYDALRISIGEASGKNWWCIVFPELCIGAAENEKKLEDVLSQQEVALVTDKDKYILEFKSVEFYEKIKSCFNVEK